MAVSAQQASTNGKCHPVRRFVFLPNTQAGTVLSGAPGLDAVQKALREAGEMIAVPSDAGSLPDRVAMAKAEDPDYIVVAGGDGTMACTAQALMGGDVTMGLIPCGTMNLLARDLGLDPADPLRAVQTILDGGTQRIDAGMVNGKVFLCAAMLGTPARLGRVREVGRQRGNGPGAWVRLIQAGFRALLRNRSLRLELTMADGRTVSCRTPALTITVNRLADTTARMFGRDVLDGGALGIYIVRRGGVLRHAMTFARTVLTGNLKTPHVEFHTATEVTVKARSAALHVMLDGELRLLPPPLQFSIAPRAVKVACAR